VAEISLECISHKFSETFGGQRLYIVVFNFNVIHHLLDRLLYLGIVGLYTLNFLHLAGIVLEGVAQSPSVVSDFLFVMLKLNQQRLQVVLILVFFNDSCLFPLL